MFQETMQLGFYEGTSLVSRLIQWQQWSPISHVAIRDVTKNRVLEAWATGVMSGGEVMEVGDWFVNHKPGTIVHVCRLRWVTPEIEARILARIWSQKGKKYDYLGVARFLSRIRSKNNDRWFCSELPSWACSEEGVPLVLSRQPSMNSPGTLWSSLRLEYLHTNTKRYDGVVHCFPDVRLMREYNGWRRVLDEQ